MEEREEHLIRNGLSKLGLEQKRKKGRSKKIIKTLRRRNMERQGQVQHNKIQKSRYNERYKHIQTIELPEYLKKPGNGESQQLMAQARCGCMERWNRYWEDEEKRKCELCEDAPGTLQHLVRDCRVTSREVNLKDILTGKRNEKTERWLVEIKWEKEARSRKLEGGELKKNRK